MLRIITLLIRFDFRDDWIKKVERTLQSKAKCDLIDLIAKLIFATEIYFDKRLVFFCLVRHLLFSVSFLSQVN